MLRSQIYFILWLMVILHLKSLSFFFQLINQKCMDDADLVELVMNSLLGRLVDSSHKVRMLCIRGLGNIASVGSELVRPVDNNVTLKFTSLCYIEISKVNYQ